MGSRLDDIKLLLQSDGAREEGKELFENLISSVLGDPIAVEKVIKTITNMPMFINETIFYENFRLFLSESFSCEEELRVFSQKLDEDGNKRENAKRIIKIIDSIESEKKTRYVINLTRSCIAGFLSVKDYFRLCTVVKNTILEDLDFLSQKIKEKDLELTPETLNLSNQGLMYMSVIGTPSEYSFLELAEMLDKFGISYGDEEKYKYSSPKHTRAECESES